MSRETIMSALCTLVFNAGPFKTTGRRVLMWSKVNNFPACFVRNIGDKYERNGSVPPKITMRAEIWLYSNTGSDPSVAPAIGLNTLADAIEASLAPDNPTTNLLTLGGLVTRCWIEGESQFDPGDLDGIAKAILPIHILVPSFT